MKKFLSLVLSLLFVLGLVNPVYADSYTKIKGEDIKFNTYLLVPEDKDIFAENFTLTFTFSVEPTEVIEQSEDSFGVNLYPVQGEPVVGTAVFNSSAGALNEAEGVDVPDGYKVLVKNVDVSFENVEFSEPGVYRWILTENKVTVHKSLWGLEQDTQVSDDGETLIRYLDVYVVDDGEGNLEIASYILREIAEDIQRTDEAGTNHDPEELEDKSYGFVNEIALFDLIFGKEVEGNQGSKDKGFLYTLTLDFSDVNLISSIASTRISNNKLIISEVGRVVIESDIESADSEATAEEIRGRKNPRVNSVGTFYAENIGADSNENKFINNSSEVSDYWNDETKVLTLKFVLDDGAYVTVKNLPLGTKYTVTEDSEDYKSKLGTDKLVSAAVEEVLYSQEEYNKYLQDNNNETPEWKVGDVKVQAKAAKYYDDPASGVISIDHGDVHTGYTNTKNGVIPTDATLYAFGGIALMLVAGAVLFIVNRKKNDIFE